MEQQQKDIKFSESFYLWLKIKKWTYSDYALKEFCREWNKNLDNATDKAINDFYHNLILEIKTKIDKGEFTKENNLK